MSILISGVDMPKDKDVAVVIHPDGTAYTAEMSAGVCTEYLADCTAAEVLSSDARPVVLCKDCKYCLVVDEYERWCNGFCSPARLVCADDYCSRGERWNEQ